MRDRLPGRSAKEEFSDCKQDGMMGDLVGQLYSDMADFYLREQVSS